MWVKGDLALLFILPIRNLNFFFLAFLYRKRLKSTIFPDFQLLL